MFKFKNHIRAYFDEFLSRGKFYSLQLACSLIFRHFPNSEVRLVSDEHCIFINQTNMEFVGRESEFDDEVKMEHR